MVEVEQETKRVSADRNYPDSAPWIVMAGRVRMQTKQGENSDTMSIANSSHVRVIKIIVLVVSSLSAFEFP